MPKFVDRQLGKVACSLGRLGQFCLDHSDTFAAAVLVGGAAYFAFRLWPALTLALAMVALTIYLTETT